MFLPLVPPVSVTKMSVRKFLVVSQGSVDYSKVDGALFSHAAMAISALQLWRCSLADITESAWV